MIKLENISKKLGNFELKNISFSLDSGDYFIILGKSGAGKSVLLELICGLLSPDTGKIYLDNKDITFTKIQNRNLGLVFQNHSLFPHLTVKENILYPLKAKHIYHYSLKSSIKDLCEILNINHLLACKPVTLSIGESQRIALARTLIMSPKCILLDEPLSSLDIQTKTEIKSLLRKINNFSNKENGQKQTIIHVTHDYEEAISLADKIAVIEDGCISQTGTPNEVFRHPKTEFIANFIGIKNFFKGNLLTENDTSKIFIPDISSSTPLNFYVSSEEPPSYGSLIIRSEDITLSNEAMKSSARNSFAGIITDIEKVRSGIEVTLKLENIFLSALITQTSLEELKLKINKKIFLSFKASAAKFLRG